jgi:hypothetical protein
MEQDERIRQAGYAASEYLDTAIDKIDSRFGAGYAQKNPLLIGSFMLTASVDYLANELAAELGDAIRDLDAGVDDE